MDKLTEQLAEALREAISDAWSEYWNGCTDAGVAGNNSSAFDFMAEQLATLLAPYDAAKARQTELDAAIAAGDGTLHGAIDYWQGRALKAEAAKTNGGWLPIESAPRDGTEILAWSEDEGRYVTSWKKFRDGFGAVYTYWVNPDIGETGPSKAFPTSWQPLPPPPEQV